MGSASIQLASHLLKAEKVLATASATKLESCRELGAPPAIDRAEPFEEAVMQATEGKGVDVVLDCVGGNTHFMQGLKVCATSARYVLYAAMAGVKVEKFHLVPFLQNRVRRLPSTPGSRDTAYKKRLVEAFSAEALPPSRRGAGAPSF